MKQETLIAAVEHNQFSHFQAMQAWPKVTVYDEDKLLYTRSRLPFGYFNSHLRTRATTDEAVELIESAIAYSRTARVPITWYTGPETKPDGMGALLSAHGFTLEDSAPGMAIDLARLPKPRRGEIVIEHITSPQGFGPWKHIIKDGFNMPEAGVEGFADFYIALGLGPESPAQHFLGLIDGEPVGAASVFLGAGATGIYNIATLNDFRGRGVGREMTLAALGFGRKKGFCVGVLQATQAGLPLYTRLGFEEVCKIGVYLFEPPAN